jgi:hypothetical protein
MLLIKNIIPGDFILQPKLYNCTTYIRINCSKLEMSIVEFKIPSTKRSPSIALYPNGFIEIRGRSMIEDLSEFSKKVEDWIDKYICEPEDLTCVDFHLEYLNTNNIRFYISLLKKIENVILKNKKLLINWYYEEGDEDIFEKGEIISFCLENHLNFIMISCVNIKEEKLPSIIQNVG